MIHGMMLNISSILPTIGQNGPQVGGITVSESIEPFKIGPAKIVMISRGFFFIMENSPKWGVSASVKSSSGSRWKKSCSGIQTDFNG
jgi:hypothetical protein